MHRKDEGKLTGSVSCFLTFSPSQYLSMNKQQVDLHFVWPKWFELRKKRGKL